MMDRDSLFDMLKHIGDAISAGVALATIIKLLPAVAAMLTIVWTTIRIFETPTVRGWMGKGPV